MDDLPTWAQVPPHLDPAVMSDDQVNLALNYIVLPHVHRELEALKRAGSRFAHYSSVEGALGIIGNKCLWLRNTAHQNDILEVRHGIECLRSYWNDTARRLRYEQVLNWISPDSANTVISALNNDLNELVDDTYITCFCAHGGTFADVSNAHEETYGRLSMWRAYNGGTTGVALVFNIDPFITNSHAYPMMFFTPVLYADRHEFAAHLDDVIERIEMSADFIRKAEAKWPEVGVLADMMFNALRFALVSTKHPGFEEEREWRIVYHPKSAASDKRSKRVVAKQRTIQEVPQTIYELSFANHPEHGLKGATLPEILNRVVIGPTARSEEIYDQLRAALVAADVPLTDDKLVQSEIPLRV